MYQLFYVPLSILKHLQFSILVEYIGLMHIFSIYTYNSNVFKMAATENYHKMLQLPYMKTEEMRKYH